MKQSKNINKIKIILIFLLILLLFIIYLIFYKQNEKFHNNNIQLVVSRYRENLDWINELPNNLLSDIIVYNKDEDIDLNIKNSKIIKLPNHGRESHSYLYHVINNYDNLADLIFFLPGSAKTHEGKWVQVQEIIKNMNNSSSIICQATDKNTYNFTIDKWEITNAENKKKNSNDNLTPATIRPYGKWFESHFPNEKMRFASFNGIVLASKEDILKRPKDFYINLLNELSFVNPEVGHYIERSWKNIFSIPDNNKL
jgi:hypothetical protein